MPSRLTSLEQPTRPVVAQAAPGVEPMKEPVPVEIIDNRAARLRARLLETTAELCAARGHRRGGRGGGPGRGRPRARPPPRGGGGGGGGGGVTAVLVGAAQSQDNRTGYPVPLVTCENLPADVDAVVVCTERDEYTHYERARAAGERRGVPVHRVFFFHPTWEPDDVAMRRLVEKWDVPVDEARWLVANRGERHDATLPMLLPSRTELHLRRYEFAAAYTNAVRVADVACGTGYGSGVLMTDGRAASVVGVDTDAGTGEYARRRFARPGVEFLAADGAVTGLPSGSVDVVTSFETIEHVDDPAALLAEFDRLLAPGGRLVLSTPNDWGLTAYHVHSFTPETLESVLSERFEIEGRWTQRAAEEPRLPGLPPGISPANGPLTSGASNGAGETLLVVARPKKG